MKALEKDRTRRYDTAIGLADDVQRFLSDEPIVARWPSVTYRASKFMKRNRYAVVASALVLAALVTAVAVTSVMMIREGRILARIQEAFYQEAVTASLSGNAEMAQVALKLLEKAQMHPSTRLPCCGGLLRTAKVNTEKRLNMLKKH